MGGEVAFPMDVSHLFFYFRGQEMIVRKVLAPVHRGQIGNELLYIPFDFSLSSLHH